MRIPGTAPLGLFFLAAVALGAPPLLKFEKAIGFGWQDSAHGWMSFVAFSQDGTTIVSDGATAPDDVSGGLSLWGFPGGKLLRRVSVRPTAVSPDLKYVASNQGVAEVNSGRSVISLADHVNAVHAFSPDSRWVAESQFGAVRGSAQIRVIDLATGRPICAFGRNRAFALAMNRENALLASGHWDLVRLWNLPTGAPAGTLRGFGRYAQSLAFNRDGTLLAAGTDFGELQVWDVRSLKRLWSVAVGGGYVSTPAFSPDGRLVAVGTYGTGTVSVIDVASGRIMEQQKVSDLGCGSVAFSPDGLFLAVPSTGGLIQWPYDRGGTIRVYRVSPR